MDQKTIKDIWEKVKANQQRLDNCKKHDFSKDITPDKTIAKDWECSNCGGFVNDTAKRWYERGLAHAKTISGKDQANQNKVASK